MFIKPSDRRERGLGVGARERSDRASGGEGGEPKELKWS